MHSVEVSTPDTAAGIRYEFDEWSDLYGDPIRDIGPISTTVDLTAYYIGQARINVTKNPLQDFGSISINDSMFANTGVASLWVPLGTETEIWVSRIDVDEAVDTAYIFDYWNSDPSDSIRPKPLGAVTDEVNAIANYNKMQYNLSFSLTPVNTWDLDTLPICETRVMYPFEVIIATNTGNIPVDYGLQTVEDFTSWLAGFLRGYNQFVLRAEFTQNALPPTTFSYSNDYVKSSLWWSTDVYFGPGGYNVPPTEWFNLWLEFLTPTGSHDYSRQTIILRVWARPTIY